MSQDVITVFEHNGVKYEFDIRDADTSELFEDALDKLQAAEKELPKEGRLSTIYRAQCNMLKDFFDTLFGEGAGVALCTEKSNISLCYNAYYALLDVVRTQKDDILETKNTFSRYSNRQQQKSKHYGSKKHNKKR